MARQVDKDERERRVRLIQQWILEGYSTTVIVRQASIMWGITERQAYTYHKYAYQYFKESNEKSIEHKKAYHIALRRKLFQSLIQKESPSGAREALRIADSMARIDGVLSLSYCGNGSESTGHGDNNNNDEDKIPTMLLPDGTEIEI